MMDSESVRAEIRRLEKIHSILRDIKECEAALAGEKLFAEIRTCTVTVPISEDFARAGIEKEIVKLKEMLQSPELQTSCI